SCARCRMAARFSLKCTLENLRRMKVRLDWPVWIRSDVKSQRLATGLVLIDAQIEKDCRYSRPRRAALRDAGADPFRFLPERILRRTDWLAKWDSGPDFLGDKHRTIVLPPATGRTPMTVHERDIGASH
ncbi:MAG: hypothetical protein ACXU84_15360, partial [Xanthobacteraceae bacterium]